MIARILPAFVCVFSAVGSLIGAEGKKPNIVFILADDLGWRDLRCYGSEWHDTPHLDQLAREGMRFTAAYASAPICSASRASLLTGKSPARLHFEFVVKDADAKAGQHPLQTPPYPLNLPLEEISLAEVLDEAGYHTGFFGKWHLGQHQDHYLGWSRTHGPLQQGFKEGDSDFGSHSYGYPKDKEAKNSPLPAGEFPKDTLIEKAIGFLRANRDRPFFLYLSQYYVHTPMQTRTPWLTEKYKARLPGDAATGRAVYGGMVETLDHLTGEVLDALQELGLAENTVVIFTSDNGGHPGFAANGPLRGSKWNLYEGGLRVPFIVRWPGRVKADTVCDVPIVGSDLMPTLCAIGGTTPPAASHDGVSILPLLLNEKWGGRTRPMLWHFPYYHPEANFNEMKRDIGVDDFAISQTHPHSAIRIGDYKLIHFYEGDRDELYDLVKDPGEQTNLCESQPEKARELRTRMEEELASSKARLPNKN